MRLRFLPSVAGLLAALSLVVASAGCTPDPTGPADVVRHDAVAEAAPVDAAPDVQCLRDEQCSDDVFCNGAERCRAGRCEPGTEPCADRFACTRDTCDEDADSCAQVPDHAMCSDRNACNGMERCNPSAPGVNETTGCAPAPPGTAPDCDDFNACTIDACDPVAGCVHGPRDADGDGHVDRLCSVDGTGRAPFGDDCNDADARDNPRAAEVCDDGRDNNCDGRPDLFETEVCSPTNDTCATATVLTGSGTYSGSTARLSADATFSCGVQGQPDAWFEFTTTDMRDLTITLASGGQGAIALYAGAACGSLMETRCARAAMFTPPLVRYRALPPGRYRFAVQTPSPTTFRVALRLDPAMPVPPEDVCPNVEPGTGPDLSDGVMRSAMFSSGRYEDDVVPSCSAGGRRDVVYRLTVTTTSDVAITARPLSGFSTTYISFRNSPCIAATSERRCLAGSSTLGATLTQRAVPPGIYWVVVENSVDMDLTVQATLTPPAASNPAESCPGVALTAGAPPTRVAFSSILAGSDVGTCVSSGSTSTSYRDAVYRFTLTETRDVVITATRVGGLSSTMGIEVHASCGARASAVGACLRPASSGTATWRGAGLPAGTYFVVFEQFGSPPPDLDVAVSATDPALRPAAEACPGAAVPLDGTPVTVNFGVTGGMGSLAAGPDVGTSCGSRGTSTSYRDAVFTYTLTTPQDVEVSIDPAGSFVYYDVRSRCLDATFTSSLGCSAIVSPATRRFRAQAPGTYTIVLETTSGAPPPMTVRVRATAPTPLVSYVLSSPPAGTAFIDVCAMPGVFRRAAPFSSEAIVQIPETFGTPLVTIPFEVRVYGQLLPPPFTVSTNGWLAFVRAPTAVPFGVIGASPDPNLVVAPYWTDLSTRANGICYAVVGTAPDRKFVVQWDDLFESPTDTGAAHLTFEVIVNEAPAGANNPIDVIYRTITGVSRTPSVGIENDDGSRSTLIPGPYTAPRMVRLNPVTM